MDVPTVKRLSYSRKIFLNDVASRFFSVGLNPAYLLPFCWWTFLMREFVRYFFPDTNTYGIENFPVAIITVLWLYLEGGGPLKIVRDVYLWYCGYGSKAKSVFTAAWFGLPCLAAIPAAALSFSLGLWLHRLGSPTLISILLRFILMWFITATAPYLIPTACIVVLMLLSTNLGRGILNATLYGIIVLQLVDFVDLDKKVFTNTAVIPYHLRESRRSFHHDAMNGAYPRPIPMNTYTYNTLPDDKDSIRLVQICKGIRPNMPTFSLVTKRLSDKPKYNAISYVWGNPMPGRNREYGLVVDGKWLATTESTFEILHEHARWWEEEHGSFFWIDFLCIDQQNNVEKNKQVKLMGKIYSQAQGVIAFLQPDDADESDVAVHFLNSLVWDMTLRRKQHYGFFPKFLVAPFFSTFIAGVFASVTGRSPSAGWNALSKLLGHRYWTRMWIVQEIALSKKLHIYYGEHKLDWGDLIVMANMGPKYMQYIDGSYGTFVHGETIDESRSRMLESFRLMLRRRDGEYLTIQALFTSVTAMKATNDFDRIWALLGLIPETLLNAWPDDMNPQYGEIGVKQLFEATARFFLEKIDSEWLLCMAGNGYSTTLNPELLDLPSWTPDWSLPHPVPLPAMRLRLGTHENRRIASVNQTGVQVFGSCITEITHVTPISYLFKSVNMERAKTHHANQLWNIKQLLRDLGKFSKYPTHEAMIDALGDTFTAGRKQDAAEDFRLHFEFWERLLPILNEIPDGPTAPETLSPRMLSRALVAVSATANYSSQIDAWAASADVCDLRSLAFDENGKMSLAPQLTKPGDLIYTVRDAQSLFVLRPERSKPFQLVGDCYMREVNPSELKSPGVVLLR